MNLHSTALIPMVLLLGATVPCPAEEASKQSFTCTAKTFNDCLMEAPCSAWKRLGPKDYKLETKIIFRGMAAHTLVVTRRSKVSALKLNGILSLPAAVLRSI